MWKGQMAVLCINLPLRASTPLLKTVLARPSRYRGRAMARPPKDDDATSKLRPEDETQRAKAGTKIGLLRKSEVLADFRKIARARKR